MNDAMSFPKAAGSCSCSISITLTISGTETASGTSCGKSSRVVDADFGVQVPADAIHLGQGQRPVELVVEHAPKAFLKRFRVGVFEHFVLADQQVPR